MSSYRPRTSSNRRVLQASYHGEELRVIRRRPTKSFSTTPHKKRRPRLFRIVLVLAVFLLVVFGYEHFSQVQKVVTSGGISGPAQQVLLTPIDDLQAAALQYQASFEISHRVGSGDTLAGIFAHYGLPVTDAQSVYTALTTLEKAHAASSIRQGQVLRLKLNKDGLLESYATELSLQRQILVQREDNGGFRAELAELPQKSQERVVNGSIQSSFALAAHSGGLPYSAIDELVDLFGDRISFHRDFRKDDEFSIVYRDTVLNDGTSLGVGTILAAALEVDGRVYYAVRYVGADGKARYFDKKGEVLGAAFLRYPVKFSRISSSFSRSRFHPVLKRNRPHNGVDFAAPTGTPVRAVGDGRVQFAGRKGGNGNMVKLYHTKRWATAYVHLHKIAKGVRTGTKVERGQVIGTVGMTGLATGPHLHYSLYDNGRYVDPLKAELPKIENLSDDLRVDPVYLRRVLYTLEHYRGRKIDIAEIEPIR